MPERRLRAQYLHHAWRGNANNIEATLEVMGGLRPLIGRKIDAPLSRLELVEMLAFLCECDKTGETADLIAKTLGGTKRHNFEPDHEAGSAWRPPCKVCGHGRDHGLHA